MIFDALSSHAPPRFTSIALPAYRFVPGLHPHPVADPRGHGFGKPPRYPVTALDGRRWRESTGYLYGCDLYNRGFWWEAHEAWETIWHLADRDSPEHAALQGLIQLANCHLKLHMGRLGAVSRLRESYGFHLERVIELAGSGFLGLNVPALRAAADAYVSDMAARAQPGHDAAAYPFLILDGD